MVHQRRLHASSHFARTVAAGTFYIEPATHPLFPGVTVGIARCDHGHPTALVLGASTVQLDMIRAEFSDVVHWFAGPGPDYNSVRKVD